MDNSSTTARWAKLDIILTAIVCGTIVAPIALLLSHRGATMKTYRLPLGSFLLCLSVTLVTGARAQSPAPADDTRCGKVVPANAEPDASCQAGE